jgi:hypothetical protein
MSNSVYLIYFVLALAEAWLEALAELPFPLEDACELLDA